MIIRYQRTEKAGDYSTTAILTVKDADPSSLDKVLKYFEPQESQQEIVVRNAHDEPEFNPDFSIKKEAVAEMIAEQIVMKTEAKKEATPTVLKHPQGKVIKKSETVQGRKKTVPLTGSTKGAFSIGELLGKPPQEIKDNPNIRTTDDGLRLYRTKWDCPGCGNSVDRFSADTNEYVKCRDCGTKARIEQSTERFLEEDKDGYYFIADKPIEV